MTRALKVYGWQGWHQLETFTQRDHRYQTRCICAAQSKKEVAALAGESGPWKLFNLSDTGNEQEIEWALAHPRQVYAQPLDTHGPDRKTRWELIKVGTP